MTMKKISYPGIAPTIFIFCLLGFCSLSSPVSAQDQYPQKAEQAQPEDQSALAEMSLEDLMNIEVSTVTRSKGQSMFESPAALYVITQDEIKRSGLLQIPEILRLAPGVTVARIDGSKWAIAARGHNNRYNRLHLVQMDGRTLYNPLFAGVYWVDQDYVTDDIDRIEVIRGPGATLWGANAVNGIISIISKPAKDTQGWLLKSNIGNEEKGIGSLRYGGKLSDNTYYRTYFKQTEQGKNNPYTLNDHHFTDPTGAPEYTPDKSDDLCQSSAGCIYEDNFRRQQAGFKMESENKGTDKFTFQGDILRVLETDVLAFADYNPLPGTFLSFTKPKGIPMHKKSDGWNLLGKWNRKLSETSDFELLTYYDWNSEDYVNPYPGYAADAFNDTRKIFDMDFQHNFLQSNRYKITWGGSYRKSIVSTGGNNVQLSFSPDTYNKSTISGFVQNSFPIMSGNKMTFTVGSKFEHNGFTGSENQPSARLTWKPNEKNFVWTAVSKAVRTPVPAHTNVNLIVGGTMVTVPTASIFGTIPPGYPPTLDLWAPVYLQGNPELREEQILAYEIGYRVMPNEKTSVDISAFVNKGHHFMSWKQMISYTPPTLEFTSNTSSIYNGVELTANYVVSDKWRLTGSYVWTETDHFDHVANTPINDETPKNQAQLRSYYDITKNLELNTEAWYTDNVNSVGDSNLSYSRSIRLDMGLIWKIPERHIEFSIWGQGLTDPSYINGAPDKFTSYSAAEIKRSFYSELTWKF